MNQPLRRPLASALAINLAVINAIVLRDIRVRAGPYYTGFLIVLLMPLGHLLALLIIFGAFGRMSPVGNDQIVYFGLSILPFVLYLYLSRRIVLAILENRPLMYFNRVKVFDILLARGLLESVSCFVVFIIVLLILYIFSDGFEPRDWTGLLFAVAMTIYMAFGLGAVNALIAQAIPFWAYAYALSVPLFWMTSGVVFFPSIIPDPYDRWLALNPLLQCVEWVRYSYYEGYPDKLLDIPYLFYFSTACLAGSLLAERLASRSRI